MDKFNILDLFTIDTSSPFDFLITSFGFMLALLMLILTITVLYIIIVFFYYVLKMNFVSEDKYDLVAEQFYNKLEWLEILDDFKDENKSSTPEELTKTLKNGFPKSEEPEKEPRYKPEHDTESLPRIQKIIDTGHFQKEAQTLYKQVEACLNKQTTRKFQEEMRRIELENLKLQTSSLEDAVKRLHRQEEITQLNQQARQLLER